MPTAPRCRFVRYSGFSFCEHRQRATKANAIAAMRDLFGEKPRNADCRKGAEPAPVATAGPSC
jgi:hypothetical protein